MKTKDLLYIGLVSYLAILLLKKKPIATSTQDSNQSTNVNQVEQVNQGTTNGQAVGNASNGGLNLNQNMDLPNLTPTADNGLSTEVALNSSNISPLIKDNEPTQIFGLPFPAELLQHATSNINPNPIDVVAPAPVVVSTPNINITTDPIVTTNESENIGTSQPVYNEPRPSIAEIPSYNHQIEEEPMPVFNTPRPLPSGVSVIKEPVSEVNPIKSVIAEEPILISENPVYNTPRPITSTLPALPLPNKGMAEEEMPVFNTPRPIKSGASIVKEPFSNPIKSAIVEEPILISENPVFNTPRPVVTATPLFRGRIEEDAMPTYKATAVKLTKPVIAKVSTIAEPTLGQTKMIVPRPVIEALISQCGNSFSIPNGDREGSYTNYWLDGTIYYMQTTSPVIKTIPIKISEELFIDGCKKLQAYKLQNS